MDHSAAAWAGRLRAAAAQTLGTTPPPPDPATFADESGHRRAVDAPFIAWCAGASRPHGAPPTAPLDVRLWHALHGAPGDVAALLGEPAAAHGALSLVSLIRVEDYGLEVATEMQLCALHALTRLRDRAPHPTHTQLGGIIRATIADLADTVQPDNATNHPWAIHAFVLESLEPAPVRPPGALHLYAQAQLHNARVQRARPDRLSAWILWDAARAIAGKG